MPLTHAPLAPDALTDLPESVLAVVQSLPSPPTPALGGRRPRYVRDVVRRALSSAARSLDATPDRRQRCLRALGELEAHLLEGDDRVERIRRAVRAARVVALPTLSIPAAQTETARRSPAPAPASIPRSLAGWGCGLSLAVLVACRHDPLGAAVGRVELWLYLLLGCLLYAWWDIALRTALSLTVRLVPGWPAWRVAVPVGFALVVAGHALALVAGFDSLIAAGPPGGSPTS